MFYELLILIYSGDYSDGYSGGYSSGCCPFYCHLNSSKTKQALRNDMDFVSLGN